MESILNNMLIIIHFLQTFDSCVNAVDLLIIMYNSVCIIKRLIMLLLNADLNNVSNYNEQINNGHWLHDL